MSTIIDTLIVCGIDDDGAEALAVSLTANSTLESLYLEGITVEDYDKNHIDLTRK